MSITVEETTQYAATVEAFAKHLTIRHAHMRTLLFSGRVSKCRVCSVFLGKIK